MKPETHLDLDELTRLCESRYGLVLEAARRFAPDSDLDRDIVQQTFLVFIKGVLEGKWALNQKDVNPLFFGIAKRVALYFWRERKKNRAESLAMIDQRFLDMNARLEDEPFEQEQFAALGFCMDKLPEKQRKFLEQHYMQDHTIESIARETQMKANSLRQVFCRIRMQLRDCIERHLRSAKSETNES